MKAGSLLLGGVAIAAIVMLAFNFKKAAAASAYACPYGDSLEFSTLYELQMHVELSHPGERIPIEIRWN